MKEDLRQMECKPEGPKLEVLGVQTEGGAQMDLSLVETAARHFIPEHQVWQETSATMLFDKMMTDAIHHGALNVDALAQTLVLMQPLGRCREDEIASVLEAFARTRGDESVIAIAAITSVAWARHQTFPSPGLSVPLVAGLGYPYGEVPRCSDIHFERLKEAISSLDVPADSRAEHLPYYEKVSTWRCMLIEGQATNLYSCLSDLFAKKNLAPIRNLCALLPGLEEFIAPLTFHWRCHIDSQAKPKAL